MNHGFKNPPSTYVEASSLGAVGGRMRFWESSLLAGAGAFSVLVFFSTLWRQKSYVKITSSSRY